MDNVEPVIYLSTGWQDMMPPYTEDWFCVYCYDDKKDTTEFQYHINLYCSVWHPVVNGAVDAVFCRGLAL